MMLQYMQRRNKIRLWGMSVKGATLSKNRQTYTIASLDISESQHILHSSYFLSSLSSSLFPHQYLLIAVTAIMSFLSRYGTISSCVTGLMARLNVGHHEFVHANDSDAF